MAYKYSAGRREFGDIDYEGDDNTQIDFDDDYIGLVAGGNNTLVVSGSKVGIGTDSPDYDMHINGSGATVLLVDGGVGSDAFVRFGTNGSLKSFIKQGSGGNLIIANETSDKDIILTMKDGATVREGLRLNGNVAEVVVNEGSESLVDFRVESNSNTHMLFVDGSADAVGINTSNPTQLLDINGDSIRIRSSLTPSSASDLGEAGMICWDANYLYVCVATDTWKRIPLDSW